MIIYNVTINVDNSAHDEWLEWMQRIHIPDVMLTGLFTGSRILKVLGDEDSGGQTYSIQYSCESMQKYNQYEELFAPGLRNQVEKKFGGKFVAFRTLLESVE